MSGADHQAEGAALQQSSSNGDLELSTCSSQFQASHVSSQVVTSHPRLAGVTLDVTAKVLLSDDLKVDQEGKKERAAVNVILVCDVSGSMSHVISKVQETVRQVGGALTSKDGIGLILFDHTVEVSLELQNCDLRTVLECADNIQSRGATNISDALLEAVNMIKRHESTSSNKIFHVYLLSDGAPNHGIENEEELRTAVSTACADVKPQVIFNSFGFTDYHAATLLQSVTTCGNTSAGAYYYLASDQDIGTCIGDCLGSVQNVLAREISISAICVESNGKTSENWECVRYSGWPTTVTADDGDDDVQMGGQQNDPMTDENKDAADELASIGFLSMGERHAVVLVCTRKGEAKGEVDHPHSVKFTVRYVDGSSGEKKTKFIDTEFPTQPIPAHLNELSIINEEEAEMDISEENDLPELEPHDLPNLEKDPNAPNVSPGKEEYKERDGDVEMEDNSRGEGEVSSEAELSFLHIMTHLTRINAAVAFKRSTDVGIDQKENLKNLEEIHGFVLYLMQKISIANAPDSTVVRDEGILMAIERDLGEIMEKLNDYNTVNVGRGLGRVNFKMDASLRNRLLQVASEHETQRSAVSFSQMSKISPYSTATQIAMRLRFLTSGNAAGDPETKKGAVKFEDGLVAQGEGLIQKEIDELIAARKKFEDESICYISLNNWRGCQLGIGLLVKPRTARERYKHLVPVVEIVPDYLSAESYNSGVRTQVKTIANTEEEFKLNREENQNVQGKDESERDHKTVTSSVRGRINAWLPLYVNATNWEFAKVWAPSAFSIIATQFNDKFQPQHALQVCSKLMIQTCVSCVLTNEQISERQIQMYCDVHRLFLEMMAEYPQMAIDAQMQITDFIAHPNKRSRKEQPDLGCLINFLTVTEQYTWNDLKEVYIQEAFRRNARFITDVCIPAIQSVDDLLKMWEVESNAGKVTMFNVMFMNVIARPAGKTIDDIKKTYDHRWGLVTQEKIDQVMAGFRDIFKARTLQEILQKLGVNMEKEAIAELILWAFENKQERKKAVQADGLPKSGGELLEEWKERSRLWAEIEAVPAREIKYLPPCTRIKNKNRSDLSGISQLVPGGLPIQSRFDKTKSVAAECDCKRCTYEKMLVQRVKDRENALQNEQKEPPETKSTLFIGRLKFSLSETDLETILKELDGYESVKLIRNRKGKSRGYAFVTFKNEGCKNNALKLLPSKVGLEKCVFDNCKRYDNGFKPKWVQSVSKRNGL